MNKVYLVSLYNRIEDYPTKLALSTMRLGSYLKNQPDMMDMHIKILPLDLNDSIFHNVNEIVRRDADIVGLPAYMWTSSKSKELTHELNKKSSAVNIVGGPETATFSYHDWSSNTIFVIGEGEKPLAEAVRSYNATGKIDAQVHKSMFSERKGRQYAVQQRDVKLARGVPLYSEKFMELLEESLDNKFTWHDTSVSCPYRCGYCGHKTRNKVALRDDVLIEEEIKQIGKQGFEKSFIIDPILGGIPGRDKKILNWYKEHAPETTINAYYRPEFFDDETIDILAGSNINEILIGLQSTNQAVPDWLRSNNLDKVKRYLPKLSENNIPSRIELITGMPGDTFYGQRESLRFVIEDIVPKTVWSYHLTIIPGTPLYSILRATESSDLWVRADNQSKAIESSSYTKKEMEEMLIYAGAITSLYNTMKSKGIHKIGTQNIRLEKLEHMIKPVIKREDPIIEDFKNSNMKKCTEFWENFL